MNDLTNKLKECPEVRERNACDLVLCLEIIGMAHEIATDAASGNVSAFRQMQAERLVSLSKRMTGQQ